MIPPMMTPMAPPYSIQYTVLVPTEEYDPSYDDPYGPSVQQEVGIVKDAVHWGGI